MPIGYGVRTSPSGPWCERSCERPPTLERSSDSWTGRSDVAYSENTMPKSKSLTPRELQVATAIAEGDRTSHEIANDLGCSVKTIDTHRQHVMKKLGLRNNVQLVYHALRAGWVSL